MKWNKIKSDYPNAYALCYRHNSTIFEAGWHKFTNRFLYEFFDEQGIFIELGLGYNNFYFGISIKESELKEWGWFTVVYEDDIERDRLDSEEMAFMKAFEILESRK